VTPSALARAALLGHSPANSPAAQRSALSPHLGTNGAGIGLSLRLRCHWPCRFMGAEQVSRPTDLGSHIQVLTKGRVGSTNHGLRYLMDTPILATKATEATMQAYHHCSPITSSSPLVGHHLTRQHHFRRPSCDAKCTHDGGVPVPMESQ
jgi:hypothetical protein